MELLDRDLLGKVLGCRKPNARVDKLCWEISLVKAGIRDAVLWEFDMRNSFACAEILDKCHLAELGVLSIASQCFIVHRQRFIESACSREFIMVNISGADPVLCTIDESSSISVLLSPFRECLEAFKCTSTRVWKAEVPLPYPHFLPTIIGWILGYPVVYVLHEDSDTHCLDNAALTVFTLSCESSSIWSFTVPSSCLPPLSNMLSKYSSNELSKVDKCIGKNAVMETQSITSSKVTF